MYILTSATGLAAMAVVGIIGGSVIATPEFESPFPRAEPVSFVAKVETTCPSQKMSPKFHYKGSCFEQVVMDFFDFD